MRKKSRLDFGYIYLTTNKINGKVYVGQSHLPVGGNVYVRYFGSAESIKEAVREFGKENFEKEILCHCFSRDALDFCERYYIKEYRSQDPKIGYNKDNGGFGKGRAVDETRQLWSKLRSGEKNPMYGKPAVMKGKKFKNTENYKNSWTLERRKKHSLKKIGNIPGNKGKKLYVTEEGIKYYM